MATGKDHIIEKWQSQVSSLSTDNSTTLHPTSFPDALHRLSRSLHSKGVEKPLWSSLPFLKGWDRTS